MLDGRLTNVNNWKVYRFCRGFSVVLSLRLGGEKALNFRQCLDRLEQMY